MARIRTVKPSFFKSLSNAALPIPTRLTFVGIWTYVDDAGRGIDDARLLKADLWPLDDGYTTKKVEADLVRLEDAGKIERYGVGDCRYFRVTAWRDHQVINRPQESRIPPSPTEGPITERSVNDHGTGTEDSRPERKGREGNPPAPLRGGRRSRRQDEVRPELPDVEDVLEAIAVPDSECVPPPKRQGLKIEQEAS